MNIVCDFNVFCSTFLFIKMITYIENNKHVSKIYKKNSIYKNIEIPHYVHHYKRNDNLYQLYYAKQNIILCFCLSNTNN